MKSEDKSNAVAVIPARGGSKRVLRKNIREFHGRPMLSWSIEAALASKCFGQVIVSTDDEEIAEVARAYGAEVPFIRPIELSGDHVLTIPVIAHAVNWLRQNGGDPGFVCCIYATAPFVLAKDICGGFDLIKKTGGDYVFPVTTFDFPIQRAVRIKETGQVEMFQPEHFNTRSQDLEEAYHDAGQFYWGKAAAWIDGTPIFSRNAWPLKIPRSRAQDIDTEEDWVIAERLFALQQNNKN
jgi:N-acylneuraminate cytidylyltransferase